jgi:DNA topoisomerase-2
MSSELYVKLSPVEHILKKSGMYIGGTDFINSKQFIYNAPSEQIIEKFINFNPGLLKICDELIVNVYDQSIKDITLDKIIATIDKKSFTIYNSGIAIPIEKHDKYKIYIPELIFGNLFTSSNFSDSEQIVGGTYGIGSKATNIFSKKFTVEIWREDKYYKQIFENNLSIINKPIITKYKGKSGVKISIEPDLEKFNCNEIPIDMISLIERRLIDLTCLLRNNINVTINDKIFKNGFNNYLELYKSENEWIIGSCIKNPLWYFAIRFNDSSLIENNHHITFVNGIYTTNGGTHVEYFIDMLLLKFKKLISNNINKRFLKDNLTICLVASVINPTFNSQTKEELRLPYDKFGYECNISNKFYDDISKSELLNKLKEVNAKYNVKLLSKFDATSKKSKIKNLPKLEDSNWAGTKKSNQCMLILTEGDSAKATALSGISAIKDGRNIYGIYPLRGKLLNVREATIKQINTNQEICDLKIILGLKLGLTYTSDNINELRYGSILLMMDADEDGSHIKGLIINFLNYFYPSLLQIDGFLKVLTTPIIKVFLKNETINFSNLHSYNNWLSKNTKNNYKTKYYKGLGTSTRDEAREYFKNLKTNTIEIMDKNNNKDILLAFAKEKISERKQWLINYKPENILQIEPPMKITVGDFINKELIHFSNYDNIRSIPLLADGLKPSQRKVLYGCFKKNLKNDMKVAQLASYVAEVSAYHHGEQSLVGTIINMAQDFIGSNNLNLLEPSGQFGTRLMGGKDHASGRYIFTYLNKIIDNIYKKDDYELLEFKEDDGEKIEPIFFLPIIPMILVNGSEGIGTGFSTMIPTFDFKDIVNWYKNKLEGKKVNLLSPKYNNFKGDIIKYDDVTYLSSGVCKIDNNNIIITELPIKLWTNNYKEILEELVDNNIIKSYTNYSSDTEVYFEIKVSNIDNFKSLENTIDDKNLNSLKKILRLYKTIKLSNLTMYDENLVIRTFSSIDEICETFYRFRLPYFEKRKILLIEKYNNELILIENQVKFINLVKSNNKIFNIDEIQFEKLLIENKIKKYNNSYDYLINMNFKQLSLTNLSKLLNKIKELKANKKFIENKSDKEIWLDDLNLIG